MLTRKEVLHIAKLARLGLKSSEVRKFQRELSSILGYVEKLKELDISGVKPTSHAVWVENVMRQDERKSEDIEVRRELVEMAPQKEKRYVKVKAVF